MTVKKHDKKRSGAGGKVKPAKLPKTPVDTPTPAQVPAKGEAGRSGVPVVGIGASAGGLDAFKKFFTAMQEGSGLAFVLVPHLDPKHESMMVELLARHTRMPVVEAKDGMAVEANRVYILAPNKYMTISGGVLRLTGPVERTGMPTSIDLFLRSLAADRQENAICIILSGTGAHGTLGLKAVKAAGGMAMVQEPTTAEYPRMPESAVATGLADFVLPVEKMPEALLRYVRYFYVQGAGGPHVEASDFLNQVLALLRTHAKLDFRCYRKKMVTRRIERRMSLHRFEHQDEYLAFLRAHPDEIKHLARDLLISVTSFFRDPEAFQGLQRDVIAPLVQDRNSDVPLRVWVPGCATGEEAYSLAILLLEELAGAQKTCRLQLFATDVDEDALEVARHGSYPESISADVSRDRLARFFTKIDDSAYQINKHVRETVVFAPQNLIADPPFSKVDLVCCRNLLIYLEPDVQQKVVTLLHFALNEGGYLFLGPSETIGRQTGLFEPVSKKWRIFRRTGVSRPERVEFPIVATVGVPLHAARPAEPGPGRPIGLGELTQRVVLDESAPAAVLINRKYEILYFLGPTTRYLDMPTGEPTQDLLMMAREGLRSKLRGALQRAVAEGLPVHLSGIQIRRNGSAIGITVTVKPVKAAAAEEGLLLVLFQDVPGAAAPAPAQDHGVEALVVQQLERDLRATKEDLQSSLEEMQSSNEELKASNEEVMSMNEELQSTNEELETSKEELQSLNEEMSTVNNQLQEKIGELGEANNDMANLLNCTNIATLFLDTKFCIRRFTLPARQLLNVIETDVGRPISDITLKFIDPDLLRDAGQVLHDLTPREKEVAGQDGRWYLRRVVPYRTMNDRIEGVVVTFTDVTGVKQAAEQSRYLATVLLDSEDAIMIHDFEGRIMAWNRGAERLYGYTQAEALQMNFQELIPEAARHIYHRTTGRLKQGERVSSWEYQRRTKEGRLVDVWVTATLLTDSVGRPSAIAKTDRDITERKKAVAQLEHEVERRTAALQESESRLRAILNAPDDAIITIDHGGVIDSVNPAAERMFGYTAAEMVGQNVKLLMPAPYRGKHDGYLKRYLETGVAHIIGVGREVEARRKDGTIFCVDLAIAEVEQLKLYTGVLRDITRRKELEREVVEIATLEQQRIGQDLHDHCAQELTALGLFAETLVNSLHGRSPTEYELAQRISQRAKGILRQVRSIAQGLVLAEVEAERLPGALTEMALRLGETSGIHFTVHADPAVPVDDKIVATQFYHIAQEACINALKHANAKNIAIRLDSEDNALVLRISDDGLGIPADVKWGLGLRIMRNRANVIGATLAIEHANPQGTAITCTLPHERSHGRK